MKSIFQSQFVMPISHFMTVDISFKCTPYILNEVSIGIVSLAEWYNPKCVSASRRWYRVRVLLVSLFRKNEEQRHCW